MMRKSRIVLVLASVFITGLLPLPPGIGTISGQVFRGYYPSGGVELQSSNFDRKKIIKSYYPGGKLEAVYEYEDGKLNGTTRQYFENGVMKAEIRYRDDKRQGLAKYYYPSGMLMAKIEFVDNKESGEQKLYDESGKPLQPINQKTIAK